MERRQPRADQGEDRLTFGALLAVAPGLRRLAFLRFALAVRAAAAFDSRPHEKLFAGDAATPNKSNEQQQRKKRTEKGSAHVLTSR